MSDSYWAFGIHAVKELLTRRPDTVAEIKILQGRGDKRIQSLVDRAVEADIPVASVPRQELDQMVSGNHQGIIALARAVRPRDERFLAQLVEKMDKPPFLLVLDGVTDPHNLGACLRSADAAGVDAVIVPKDNSAPLNATVQKVACGAAEVIPLVQVTNLSRTLKGLKEQGVWITGFAGEAEQELYTAGLTGPIALVMGAEGSGMRRLTREQCDFLVKIPMGGSVSSLNVSVATGVALFEALRQRSG